MKKISRWLKLIATGSVSLLLSACYGVQQELMSTDCQTIDIRVQTENGDDIPGIRVSYQYAGEDTTEFWNPLGTTNDSGSITVDLITATADNIYIKVEDIDGELHGSFQPQVVLLKDETSIVTMKSL